MKKIFLTIIVLTLTACNTVNKPVHNIPQPLDVTVSFYPSAYLAQRIGGKFVKVSQITPTGVEPHDYEPTPADLVKINNSKVFIMNGSGADPWADNVFENLKTSQIITLKATTQNSGDPHIWLDPTIMENEAMLIRNIFIQADPANSDKYKLNAAGLINDLKALDQEFKNGLKECRIRQLITSHDAFKYMGKRYNFESIPIAGISPDEEPSPKHLAQLSDLANKNNIKYIFFETLVSPKLAETLAQEVGAKSLVLNPIEGLTSGDLAKGKDYLVLMQENLTNLRTAMQCK